MNVVHKQTTEQSPEQVREIAENLFAVKVLSKTTWTETLFSFTVSRPDSFRFTAGQFVRIGINPSKLSFHQTTANVDTAVVDEDIFRAYSIVSSPYDENIEFFSIVIPDGAFTSQLQHLQVGDELLLNTTPFGYLTLARYQKPLPKDLWLLATGTGVAPFISILQDIKTWQDYEHIILAYSARTQSELAYVDKIKQLVVDFAELTDSPAKFSFVPIITREIMDGCLNKRLPELITTNQLQQHVGLEFNRETSQIMLCGNPQMVDDTKEALKSIGMVMNRRGEGNIAVENYW